MLAIESLEKKILCSASRKLIERDNTAVLVNNLSDVDKQFGYDLEVHFTMRSTCINQCSTFACLDEKKYNYKKICYHPHNKS